MMYRNGHFYVPKLLSMLCQNCRRYIDVPKMTSTVLKTKCTESVPLYVPKWKCTGLDITLHHCCVASTKLYCLMTCVNSMSRSLHDNTVITWIEHAVSWLPLQHSPLHCCTRLIDCELDLWFVVYMYSRRLATAYCR